MLSEDYYAIKVKSNQKKLDKKKCNYQNVFFFQSKFNFTFDVQIFIRILFFRLA